MGLAILSQQFKLGREMEDQEEWDEKNKKQELSRKKLHNNDYM